MYKLNRLVEASSFLGQNRSGIDIYALPRRNLVRRYATGAQVRRLVEQGFGFW